MSSPGSGHSSEEAVVAGQLQTLQPLTNDLIAAVLSARDFSFYSDSDGDLVGRWEENLIYFFRAGPEGQVLQVRTMAATTFPIEQVPELYSFCNTWNHEQLWPKTYVHVDDDGSARVCGEVTASLTQGVTVHQLDQLINCGISTGCAMSESVAKLRP
ncbi:putative sensory transduction regulator [Micromonospora pisi]|uniref:Putative sensory transduction regulator n=1 Tax=Micromonospora pisi TaxID=589240 RepID=A0A495JPF1_9ACTN|nr:YbjN domain-containing protein [Micromonospora pisi]RKR90843.1 putative sensory transduction regulator [Micromonospora pisi]